MWILKEKREGRRSQWPLYPYTHTSDLYINFNSQRKMNGASKNQIYVRIVEVVQLSPMIPLFFLSFFFLCWINGKNACVGEWWGDIIGFCCADCMQGQRIVSTSPVLRVTFEILFSSNEPVIVHISFGSSLPSVAVQHRYVFKVLIPQIIYTPIGL